jgi:antirestriction protein ArdC
MARKTNTRPPRTYDQLKPKLDVHEAITAKIVAAIEAGAGEFQMPWHRPGVAFTIPRNALTENQYRGSNVLSLWIDAGEKKFEHQVWATYKQWEELGAQVRKGEKGSLIVKYGEWIPKDARDDAKSGNGDDEDGAKRLYAKAAYVFNVQQVDGFAIEPAVPRPDLTERLDHVDAFIAATGAEFREGGQRAFYRHRGLNGEGDFIQMPERNLFTGTATSTPTESYEGTRLHELGHYADLRIMPRRCRSRGQVRSLSAACRHNRTTEQAVVVPGPESKGTGFLGEACGRSVRGSLAGVSLPRLSWGFPELGEDRPCSMRRNNLCL